MCISGKYSICVPRVESFTLLLLPHLLMNPKMVISNLVRLHPVLRKNLKHFVLADLDVSFYVAQLLDSSAVRFRYILNALQRLCKRLLLNVFHHFKVIDHRIVFIFL